MAICSHLINEKYKISYSSTTLVLYMTFNPGLPKAAVNASQGKMSLFSKVIDHLLIRQNY